MSTIVNINVNALIDELNRQSKSKSNWRLLCYLLSAYVGYKCGENKKLKEKIKALTNEIEEMKIAKGE